MTTPIVKGDRVYARYGTTHNFYVGWICDVHVDGAVEVNWDDEDPRNRLLNPSDVHPYFADGEQVVWCVDGQAIHASIERFCGEGLYALNLGAEAVRDVAACQLRRLRPGFVVGDAVLGEYGGGGRYVLDAARFAEGDAVFAEYGGGGRYFPAKVMRVNADDSVSVDWDDGDTLYRTMDAQKIRHRSDVRPSVAARPSKIRKLSALAPASVSRDKSKVGGSQDNSKQNSIDHIKDKAIYKFYISQLPKELRTEGDPQTPKLDVPVRKFRPLLVNWHVQLHRWCKEHGMLQEEEPLNP